MNDLTEAMRNRLIEKLVDVDVEFYFCDTCKRQALFYVREYYQSLSDEKLVQKWKMAKSGIDERKYGNVAPGGNPIG